MHRDEVAGSQEVMATSEDELQNTSDTATVVTNGEVTNGEEDPSASQGPVTPIKKVKKRKDGVEPGSASKKQKKVYMAS
jgi:hypothetical protein